MLRKREHEIYCICKLLFIFALFNLFMLYLLTYLKYIMQIKVF